MRTLSGSRALGVSGILGCHLFASVVSAAPPTSPTLEALPAAPFVLSCGDPRNPCPDTLFFRQGDRFEGGEDLAISAKSDPTVDQPSGEPRISVGWNSKNPGAASMRFEQTLVTWRYQRCSRTVALVDGARVEFSVLNVEGDVWQHGYVKERVTFGFVGDLLESLATARVVEYRVCGFEFALSEPALCALRTLARIATESTQKAPKLKAKR